jgi:hypothetical protein
MNMFRRDPVHSLAHALHRALWHDLDARRARHGADARPREHECSVILFGQLWSDQALGLCGGGHDRHRELDTVVIIGPAQDACVYVATRLLYHVAQPNRRFFLDVAAHAMAPSADAHLYEGRDDCITEAVDIEVGVLLARLHAQVKEGEPQRARLIARYLRRCAERFESKAPSLRLAWGGIERRRA